MEEEADEEKRKKRPRVLTLQRERDGGREEEEEEERGGKKDREGEPLPSPRAALFILTAEDGGLGFGRSRWVACYNRRPGSSRGIFGVL